MTNELAVVKYDVTDLALSELKAKYAGLTIADTDSYDVVRRAIGEVRDIRVNVEERRKELKASALEYGRKVDSEAKRITALLLQIEEPLKAEKQKVDDEKARIKAEKEQKELDRVAAIRAKIFTMQQLVSNFLGKTALELQAISEQLFDTEITRETFQEFTDEAERVKMECLDISLKAREVRIKWEAEEAARKVEAERLEKQRQEQEAEAKRLADEKAKLEAEKKAEQARKDREEIERLAKEKAEKEAREKVEREAKEKKEKEEAEEKERVRKEALRPDKEKLLAYGEALMAIPSPVLSDKKARAILADVNDGLDQIDTLIKTEVQNL